MASPYYNIDVNQAWSQIQPQMGAAPNISDQFANQGAGFVDGNANTASNAWKFNQNGVDYWASPMYGQGRYEGMDNYIPGDLTGYMVYEDGGIGGNSSVMGGHHLDQYNGMNYDIYDPTGAYQSTKQFTDAGGGPTPGVAAAMMVGGMAGAMGAFGGAGASLAGAEAAAGAGGAVGGAEGLTAGMGALESGLAPTMGGGWSAGGAAGASAGGLGTLGEIPLLEYSAADLAPLSEFTSTVGTGTGTGAGVTSTFNAAKDSQLANTLIEAGTPGFEHIGTDALAGYTSNYGSVVNPATGQGTNFSGSNPPVGTPAPGTPSSPAPGTPTTSPTPTGTPNPGSGNSDGGGGIGMEEILALIGGITGAGGQNDAADELLAYLTGQQAKIDNLYAPGSPEYNYLLQSIERQDAASGRNSQYGPRSVDLAARIAQIKADNTSKMTQGIAPYMAFAMNQDNNQWAGVWDALGGIDWGNLAEDLDLGDIWDSISGLFD
jgi:hypothetical protein